MRQKECTSQAYGMMIRIWKSKELTKNAGVTKLQKIRNDDTRQALGSQINPIRQSRPAKTVMV